MSIKGKLKEAAGFVEEEAGEKIKDDKVADKGRKLRNEGRVADGKPAKTTKPGTGHPEK